MNRLATWMRALRLVETLPFCGVTFLGGLLAIEPGLSPLPRPLIFATVGVFFLASFAFGFNDLQDLETDRRSSVKPDRPLVSGTMSVKTLQVFLVVAPLAGLGILLEGTRWVVVCAGMATILLSILYSWRPVSFKTVPVVSTVVHLAEGTLSFLLGWWSVGSVEPMSIFFGAYFGIVFAAGHLHHEVMDFDADRDSGVKTHAVRFGPRSVLLSGVLLWCVSALLFSWLAFEVSAKPVLGWIQLTMFGIYLTGFAILVRGRTDLQALRKLQRLYRITYLVGGLAMVCFLSRHWLGS